MKTSQLICLVMLLLILSMPSLANELSKGPRFTIRALTEIFPENSRQREGALELTFQNTSQNEICIPISGPYAKGIGFRTPIYAAPGERFFQPVSFAVFRYDWFDSKGKAICNGTYDASSDDMVLKPRQVKRLWIPIRLPGPGAYKLVVTFANRELEPARCSYNCRNFDAVFVTLEDQALITIKESASAAVPLIETYPNDGKHNWRRAAATESTSCGMLGDGLILSAKEIAVCRIGTAGENVEICSSDKKFKIVQQWLREHINSQLLNTRVLESSSAKYRLFLFTTCLKYLSPAKQGFSTLVIIPLGHEQLGKDYEKLCEELRKLMADEKPRKK